jgi:hypothetical protein
MPSSSVWTTENRRTEPEKARHIEYGYAVETTKNRLFLGFLNFALMIEALR